MRNNVEIEIFLEAQKSVTNSPLIYRENEVLKISYLICLPRARSLAHAADLRFPPTVASALLDAHSKRLAGTDDPERQVRRGHSI